MAKRNNKKYKVEKKKILKPQNVKFRVPRVKNLASRLENKGKEK
jgi:hypothetical protein